MMDTLGIVAWCSMFTSAALFGIGYYDEKFNYPVPLMACICITLATTFAYWILCCTYCQSSPKRRLRSNNRPSGFTPRGSTFPRGSNHPYEDEPKQQSGTSDVDPKNKSRNSDDDDPKNRSGNFDDDYKNKSGNHDFDPKNRSGNSDFDPKNRSGNSDFDPKNKSGNSDLDPKNKSGNSDLDPKNKSGNSDLDPKNKSGNSDVDPKNRSGTNMKPSTASICDMDIEDLELMIGTYFLSIQLCLANKLKAVMNFCIICGCIAPKIPHLGLRFAFRLPKLCLRLAINLSKLCLRLAIKLPKLCFRFMLGICKFCLSYILRLGKFIIRLTKIGFNFCLCKLFKLFRCIKFCLGKIRITIGKVCSLCMGLIKLIPEQCDECKETTKSPNCKTSSAKFPSSSHQKQSPKSKGEVKERAGSIIIYRQADEDVEILDIDTPLHRGSDKDDEKSLKEATLKKATDSTGLEKDQLNVKSSIDVELEKKHSNGTKSRVIITYWFAEVSVKAKVKEAKWIAKDDFIEDNIDNEDLAEKIERLGQDESESEDETSKASESDDESDSWIERKKQAFKLKIRGKGVKVERRHGASPKKNSEAHDDDEDEEFSLWWLLVLALLLVVGGVVCIYFLRPEWIETIKSKFTN